MIFQREDFSPTVAKESWRQYPAYSNPKFEMNIGSCVIKGNSKTRLVDTGLEKLDHGIDQPVRETLLSELDAFNIIPNDIDIVFLTHLHMDHVGTSMVKDNGVWKPTFPNARYIVGKSDWEMFSGLLNKPTFKYLKEHIQPLLSNGTLDFFGGKGRHYGRHRQKFIS